MLWQHVFRLKQRQNREHPTCCSPLKGFPIISHLKFCTRCSLLGGKINLAKQVGTAKVACKSWTSLYILSVQKLFLCCHIFTTVSILWCYNFFLLFHGVPFPNLSNGWMRGYCPSHKYCVGNHISAIRDAENLSQTALLCWHPPCLWWHCFCRFKSIETKHG